MRRSHKNKSDEVEYQVKKYMCTVTALSVGVLGAGTECQPRKINTPTTTKQGDYFIN